MNSRKRFFVFIAASRHRAFVVAVNILLFVVLLSIAPASAQSAWSERVTAEFVGAITTSSLTPDDPFIVLDGTATVRMTDDLDVIIRPWFRRLPGGDWSKRDVSAPGAVSDVHSCAGADRRGDHLVAARDHRPLDAARSQSQHRLAVVLLLAAALLRRTVRSRAAPVGRISARRDRELVGTPLGRARRRSPMARPRATGR